MGNGSLNAGVYGQVISNSFNITWSSQVVSFTKVGVPLGSGLVTLKFNSFSITVGATSSVSIVSTPISFSGVNITPSSTAPVSAVPIKLNGSEVGLGWLQPNISGILAVYGPLFTSTYWTANATGGISQIITITYAV